jgi:carboxyl-terminal processing protease
MNYLLSTFARRPTRVLLILAVVGAACVLHVRQLAAESITEPGDRSQNAVSRLATRYAIMLAERRHYNRPVVNDAVSTDTYESYFDFLDPNHHYFLASDLDDFAGYRLALDDAVKKGDLDFSLQVFERFLQRVSQRVAYVQAHVNDQFDFTLDEDLTIDRSEAPWPSTTQDLDDLWRRRIKDHLLVEAILAEEVAEKEEDDSRFKDDTISSQMRIQRRYEQYLRFYQSYDIADIMEGFLTAMLQTQDPHSTYLNWRSLEDFNIAMRLSLQGIGATLKSVDGYTEVVDTVPGGPAHNDGTLQTGDRIIAVGQAEEEPISVVDLPLKYVVRKIRGKKGTEVRLTILKSLNGVPQVVSLIRDQVKLTEQEASGEIHKVPLAGGGSLSVGILDIPSFYADFDALRRGDPKAKSTTSDVRKIVSDMLTKDVKGILIDLRSNGGGSLEEAIQLSGLFVPSGPVVQVQSMGNNAHELEVRTDDDDNFAFDLPLVVMTNRFSASASEILAGAIQDYDRGVIVGDATTHGKGTVQTVFQFRRYPRLSAAKVGAMKYTMAKFYRVTGASTQKKGVTPDIIYPSFLDHLKIGEASLDNVLAWDEISRQPFVPATQRVSEMLPTLNERASSRFKDDTKFQEIVADIARYGERQEQKSITLNKAKRIAQRKEDEYLAERSKAVLGADEDDNEDQKDAADHEDKDIYLRHAERILADLIVLNDGRVRLTGTADQSPATPKPN